MIKILFTNTNCSWNKGSAAQVISTMQILQNCLSEVSFAMLSFYPSFDRKYARRYGISLIGYSHPLPFFEPFLYGWHLLLSLVRCLCWRFLDALRVNGRVLLHEKFLNAYLKADLIIDLSGDSFADTRFSSIINCLGLFPGILLRKPIVLFSQSIGPFKWISYPFVKFCFNNVRLITARGMMTKTYLDALKINPQIRLVSDCAFMLHGASRNLVEKIGVQEGITMVPNGYIGVSVSALFARTKRDYVAIMVKMIEYLLQELNSSVLLISHSFLPTEDDRIVARKIYDGVENNEHLFIVKREYSAEALKGVIGLCSVFIGSRMHAAIGALSSGIPTLVIADSHKYYEVMEGVGQEQFICDLHSLSLQELVMKINKLWKNRDLIRMDLTLTLKKQKALALYGGMLVKKEVRSYH